MPHPGEQAEPTLSRQDLTIFHRALSSSPNDLYWRPAAPSRFRFEFS